MFASSLKFKFCAYKWWSNFKCWCSGWDQNLKIGPQSPEGEFLIFVRDPVNVTSIRGTYMHFKVKMASQSCKTTQALSLEVWLKAMVAGWGTISLLEGIVGWRLSVGPEGTAETRRNILLEGSGSSDALLFGWSRYDARASLAIADRRYSPGFQTCSSVQVSWAPMRSRTSMQGDLKRSCKRHWPVASTNCL